MALTKVSRGLLSTGIVDNSTTTAITIDSSENVGIGTSPAYKLDVASPVIQFGDSTDAFAQYKSSAGNWHVGANSSNSFAFYSGTYGSGTERMRIDSSGNVGIGCTPASKLDIDISTNARGYFADTIGEVTSGTFCLQVVDSANTTLKPLGFRAEDIRFATGSAERMRITSGGILEFNNNAVISVNDTADSMYLGGGGTLPNTIQSQASALHNWQIGASNVMRIDSSGNLLVGCTGIPTGGSSTGFSISDNGGMQMVTHGVSGTGNTYVNIYKNANGTVGGIRVSGSQTFFDGSSDQRLKSNIVDAPSASEDIDAIQVRSFNWKADNEYQKYGMIAQELATVAPIAVYQPENPEEMQAVDYSKLVPMLVKEIQSLRSRVAQLENN